MSSMSAFWGWPGEKVGVDNFFQKFLWAQPSSKRQRFVHISLDMVSPVAREAGNMVSCDAGLVNRSVLNIAPNLIDFLWEPLNWKSLGIKQCTYVNNIRKSSRCNVISITFNNIYCACTMSKQCPWFWIKGGRIDVKALVERTSL